MAAKLLNEQYVSGAVNLNSYIGVGETMIGAILAETTPGAVFVEAEPWGGPETILLVEDEGFVETLLRRSLSRRDTNWSLPAAAARRWMLTANWPSQLICFLPMSLCQE